MKLTEVHERFIGRKHFVETVQAHNLLRDNSYFTCNQKK